MGRDYSQSHIAHKLNVCHPADSFMFCSYVRRPVDNLRIGRSLQHG